MDVRLLLMIPDPMTSSATYVWGLITKTTDSTMETRLGIPSIWHMDMRVL